MNTSTVISILAVSGIISILLIKTSEISLIKYTKEPGLKINGNEALEQIKEIAKNAQKKNLDLENQILNLTKNNKTEVIEKIKKIKTEKSSNNWWLIIGLGLFSIYTTWKYIMIKIKLKKTLISLKKSTEMNKALIETPIKEIEKIKKINTSSLLLKNKLNAISEDLKQSNTGKIEKELLLKELKKNQKNTIKWSLLETTRNILNSTIDIMQKSRNDTMTSINTLFEKNLQKRNFKNLNTKSANISYNVAYLMILSYLISTGLSTYSNEFMNLLQEDYFPYSEYDTSINMSNLNIENDSINFHLKSQDGWNEKYIRNKQYAKDRKSVV